jgi:hypothetical protein
VTVFDGPNIGVLFTVRLSVRVDVVFFDIGFLLCCLHRVILHTTNRHAIDQKSDIERMRENFIEIALWRRGSALSVTAMQQ